MKTWVQSILISTGFLLVIFGIVLKMYFPTLMSKKLEEKLIIRADSPTLGNFISPPIPIYMQFYFFNVTNSEDILDGSKPILDEIGPYSYLEKRTKHDLNWTDSTVEYLENTKFFFDADMSGGLREDDMITTINPVLMTLAAKVDSHEIAHAILEMLKLRFDLKPFITRKAGELLFKGYKEDLFLTIAPMTQDPIHKSGKFGFFYPKNDSDGGKYSVGTGADTLENLQLITSWKDQPTLDYWNDEKCNMINGTTGSQFPQPIVQERNISMFSADLCRSLYLSFEKEITFGGLVLFRYILPYEVLSNRPENQCYCSDDFTCRSSMVNLSPCRKGAPVLTSTPHFYMGDAETVAAVVGLNPTKEYHETYIDVEPNTGVSFSAMKRIQISMPLRRYGSLLQLSKVQEVVLPILWLNESAQVPEDRARSLHMKLTKPLQYVQYTCWALYVVGAVLIITTIVLIVVSKRKNNQKDTTEGSSQPDRPSSTSSDPKESQPLQSTGGQHDFYSNTCPEFVTSTTGKNPKDNSAIPLMMA